MSVVTINKERTILTGYGKDIPILNIVRNEVNGWRKLTEKCVYTENFDGSKGVPYMPRLFPTGNWNIVGFNPETEPYLYPFFIITNAWQEVDEWLIKPDGSYDKPSGVKVKDYGYGIHFSVSTTTLGCIRIVNQTDLLWFKNQIETSLNSKETINLEVY